MLAGDKLVATEINEVTVMGMPGSPMPVPMPLSVPVYGREGVIVEATHHEPHPVAPPVAPPVQSASINPEFIPLMKFPVGSKVCRRASIDPPMPQAIFRVVQFSPTHGMHGKPRYWGPDDGGEMQGGYEDELELMP